MGYMDAMHDSLCKQAKTERDIKTNHLVMTAINQRVIEMLFPDGKLCSEEINHIGEQMNKLKIGDRMNEMMDSMYDSVKGIDVSNIKTKEETLAFLKKIIHGGNNDESRR